MRILTIIILAIVITIIFIAFQARNFERNLRHECIKYKKNSRGVETCKEWLSEEQIQRILND